MAAKVTGRVKQAAARTKFRQRGQPTSDRCLGVTPNWTGSCPAILTLGKDARLLLVFRVLGLDEINGRRRVVTILLL